MDSKTVEVNLEATEMEREDHQDLVSRWKRLCATCWHRSMNPPTTCGFINNIFFPWLIITVFFGIGLSIANFMDDDQVDQDPGFVSLPDAVVPIIWYAIAALTGIVRFRLVRDDWSMREENNAGDNVVGNKNIPQFITGYQVAIGAYCVYALPISGFPGLVVGLIGNALTGAYCLWIVLELWKGSRRLDSVLMLPSIPWLCFASALIISSMINMKKKWVFVGFKLAFMITWTTQVHESWGVSSRWECVYGIEEHFSRVDGNDLPPAFLLLVKEKGKHGSTSTTLLIGSSLLIYALRPRQHSQEPAISTAYYPTIDFCNNLLQHTCIYIYI